jgi:hypothetical protein
MKQTAVEWFFDELYSIRKTIPFENQADAILKAFEQAKAMEKEQIMRAHSSGYNSGMDNEIVLSYEYYIKTFKSK